MPHLPAASRTLVHPVLAVAVVYGTWVLLVHHVRQAHQQVVCSRTCPVSYGMAGEGQPRSRTG